MNQDQQVCDTFMRLIDTFKHTIAQLAEAHGLTKMQLFLLYTLERQGETAMGRVADVLHCDASNVTGIVDRLVTSGLIARQELATDRRTKTVQLTDKGKKTVAALKAELPERLGCNRLTDADVAALQKIAQKIAV
ncbi:MAG TPA: MarR family transcriptional regulator [Candidatus Saccharimonadales bacterium]|nr:MarR family transcriptional regulator [Candidatus Saccharimonadales bacterium]